MIQTNHNMYNYDEQYYLINSAIAEITNLPSLTPDIDTSKRGITYEQMSQGSAPLIFSNGFKEMYEQKHINPIENIPEVLFYGSFFAVSNDIHREISKLKLDYAYSHPAVYIHDDEKWYEGYWFYGFDDAGFDCWDREKSKHSKPRRNSGLINFFKYSLSTKVLDETPLENRLLFKMAKASDGVKVCHESIKHLFDVPGVKLTRIDEW